MNNQIIQLDEKNRKVFGFSEDRIIISSKGHSSFESLVASAEKSGMLESVKDIPMDSVTEVMYNEKEDTIKIKYEKNGKSKKENLTLEDPSFREAIVSAIGAQKGFSKGVKEESKTQPLLFNLLFVVLIPVFTWVARNFAIDAQNGAEYEATGRRSGIKQLIANAVEFVGPTGVLIIGGLGLIYMIYRTYNRYTHPASEITYN